jgi:hypothetical protein
MRSGLSYVVNGTANGRTVFLGENKVELKKYILGFSLALPLAASASAQIIKGSAASMKLPMPDLSAGPTKTCHTNATGDLPDDLSVNLLSRYQAGGQATKCPG